MSGTLSENKILMTVRERLGLNEAALKKAEEFLRVYEIRSTIRNLNEFAKVVLCLDLAASQLGVSFDKETALKLSGLRKQPYQNYLHFVEKVLDLDKPLSITEACVQLSCTEVKDYAEKILNNYKQSDNIEKDFNHPQYISAAIYAACKTQNVKVQRSQFVTISRLKPTQWKELESEFLKFAENLGFVDQAKSKKKKGNELLEYVEKYEKEKEVETKSRKKKTAQDNIIEDYEIWKDRILKEARAALS